MSEEKTLDEQDELDQAVSDAMEETREPNELLDEDEHLEWVSLDDLDDDPNQVRETYDENALNELAASIKAVGLLQNIVTYRTSQGRYNIVAGHRRKRALRIAGKLRTRVIVRHTEMLDADVIAAMFVENNQRVPLNPIEEARGLLRLKELRGITNDKVLGELVGKSNLWVTDRIRLLSLSPEQQRQVARRELSIRAGAELSRVNTGRKRPGMAGKGKSYLGVTHPLSNSARQRCATLGHAKSGPNRVGGVACGECWEAVIIATAQLNLTKDAVKNNQCGVCGNLNVDIPMPTLTVGTQSLAERNASIQKENQK